MGKTRRTAYERWLKRALDLLLCVPGLALLLAAGLVIAVAIEIDDPGPVFFTQERIGRDKKRFRLHKFRSMRMSTPHDTPTHLLQDPEQYITRVGRFLRRSSLDELPQIWDIFLGSMSVVGPRPALWNQDDLIAERDKYDANSARPGLTGWAQVNGRDELEIPEKARLDGEYIRALRAGVSAGLAMDARCFLQTIRSVAQHKGVVEGGTGAAGSKGETKR